MPLSGLVNLENGPFEFHLMKEDVLTSYSKFA